MPRAATCTATAITARSSAPRLASQNGRPRATRAHRRDRWCRIGPRGRPVHRRAIGRTGASSESLRFRIRGALAPAARSLACDRCPRPRASNKRIVVDGHLAGRRQSAVVTNARTGGRPQVRHAAWRCHEAIVRIFGVDPRFDRVSTGVSVRSGSSVRAHPRRPGSATARGRHR